MDFTEALAAVQQWIGAAISASVSVPGGQEYLRVTGVVDTPELLWSGDDDEGELWMFPLVDNVGSFALARSSFVDAEWETAGVRLRVQMTTGVLDIETA